MLAQFGHVRQAVRGLSGEQLALPTRLPGWTVRELAAHVTMAVGSVSRNLERDEPAKAELALLDWPFATAVRAGDIADRTQDLAAANPTSTPSTPVPRNGSGGTWRRHPATASSPRSPAP